MASEKTKSYRAGPGFAPLPKNVKTKANARGGVKTPPYKPAYTVVFPGNPAWDAPLPGGMYASPTNKATAYTNQKRCRRANVPGPHTCGPYEPTGNGR